MKRGPLLRTIPSLVLLAAAPLLCLCNNPYLNILQRDQWRMVPLVADFFAGKIRIASLFAPHGDTSIVLYKALFLLNGIFLGLNMTCEYYLGLGFIFLFSCVLFTALRQRSGNKDGRESLPILALVLIVIYSQSQIVLWHYSFMTVMFGFLLLSSALAAAFLDKYLRVDGRRRHAAMSLLCLAFLILGFSTAAFITMIALILLLGLLLCIRPGIRKKILAYSCVLLLLMAVAAVLQSFYSTSRGIAMHEGRFQYVLLHVTESVRYLILLLGSSVLPGSAGLAPQPMHILAGAPLLFAYVAAIYLFIRRRQDIGSILPLFLIFFTFAMSLVLSIGRMGTDYGPPTAPRYVSSMRVGLMGLVWIFGHGALQLRRLLLKWSLFIALFCLVALAEAANFTFSMGYNTSLYPQLQQEICFLRSRQYDRLSLLSPGNRRQLVIEADEQLRRLGLNLYHDDSGAGDAADDDSGR